MFEFARESDDKENRPLSDVDKAEVRRRWGHYPQYLSELLQDPKRARWSLENQRALDTLTPEEQKAVFQVLGPNRRKYDGMSLEKLRSLAADVISSQRLVQENVRRNKGRERQQKAELRAEERLGETKREAEVLQAEHQEKTALSKDDYYTLREQYSDDEIRAMTKEQIPINLSPQKPESFEPSQAEVPPVEAPPQETFFGANLQEALDNGAIPKLNKEKPQSKKKGRKGSRRIQKKIDSKDSGEIEAETKVEESVELRRGPKVWRSTPRELTRKYPMEAPPISQEELAEREEHRIARYGGLNAYRKYQSLLENSDLLRRQMENTTASSVKEERHRNWDKQKRVAILLTENALRKEHELHNPHEQLAYPITSKESTDKHVRIAKFMSLDRKFSLSPRDTREKQFEKLAISLENRNEAALRFYLGDVEAGMDFNFWEDRVNNFREKMGLAYQTLLKITDFGQLGKYKEEQRGRRGRVEGETRKELKKGKEEGSGTKPVKSPQGRRGVIPRRVYEGSSLEDDEQEYKLKHMPERPKSADIPPQAEDKPEPTPESSGEKDGAEEYWDNLLPRGEGVKTEEATQKTNVAPSEFGGDLLIEKLKRAKFGPPQGEVPPTVETVPPKTGGPLWSGERPPIIDTRPPIIEGKGPSASEAPPPPRPPDVPSLLPPSPEGTPAPYTLEPEAESQSKLKQWWDQRGGPWLEGSTGRWYAGDRMKFGPHVREGLFWKNSKWEEYNQKITELTPKLNPIDKEIARLELGMGELRARMGQIDYSKGTGAERTKYIELDQHHKNFQKELVKQKNKRDRIQTKIENASNRRAIWETKRNQIAVGAIERLNARIEPYERKMAPLQENALQLKNEIDKFKGLKQKYSTRIASLAQELGGAEFEFRREEIREDMQRATEKVSEMDGHISERSKRHIKLEEQLAGLNEAASPWQDMRAQFARITQTAGADLPKILESRGKETYYSRGPEVRVSPPRPVIEQEHQEERDVDEEQEREVTEPEVKLYTPTTVLGRWRELAGSSLNFTNEQFQKANPKLPLDKPASPQELARALQNVAGLLAQEGRTIPTNFGKNLATVIGELE